MYYVSSDISIRGVSPDSFRYLSHHGILGQKWGVRRYQNPDGSLTPAGRTRYDLQNKKILEKEERWRSREIQRAQRKYGIERLDKKINKAEEKGNILKAEVLKDKKEYRKGLLESETNKIKQMKIDDIRKENIKVGASIVGKALVAGSFAALPVLKLTATPIFLAEAAKTHFFNEAVVASLLSNKAASEAAWAGYNAASAKLFGLNAAPVATGAVVGRGIGQIGVGGMKSRNRLTSADYEKARKQMNSRTK